MEYVVDKEILCYLETAQMQVTSRYALMTRQWEIEQSL